MAAALAIAAVATILSAVQVIPSAYAVTATGGSAITEGACSTGSFANDLLASIASSCGQNASDTAAGDIAICKGDEGGISIAIKGSCSTSN
jgi:hypothetical protein